MAKGSAANAPSILYLPVELRLSIYSLCFGHEETALPRWAHGQAPRGVALLRTCRTVYNEAWPIFYSQTTIVLNGKGIQPFPATIDRHFGSADARTWLRQLAILEPRAMPYRYPQDRFPPRKLITDWNFDILRHLPNVRAVTISDITPIPIHVLCSECCSKIALALEQYICLQMSQTMLAFSKSGIQNFPSVTIFASARITFVGSLCFCDASESTECKWRPLEPKAGCSREVEAKTQLHPPVEQVAISSDNELTARQVLLRHVHYDDDKDWFPVRCI